MDEICEDYCLGVTVEKGIKDTGRKAYHPADMLKIYVYGYFNGISSSRRLERETGRNIELQWLASGIVPDHKTISDFRKDNLELVQGLFKHLINEFKEQGLIKGKTIAVDGTKIKAYASKELNIKSIKDKLDGIEGQVEKYLKDIDTLDKVEDDVESLENKKAELEKELEVLAERKKVFQELKESLESQGENRVSLTDADAKIMRGRYGIYWGYNVQSAVDTESHFITAIDVTNNQNDKGLLAPMVAASESTTGQKAEESLADGGYYKITELENLEKEGTQCFVALNATPSQVKDQEAGLKFTYDQQEDRYHCNEGKPLVYKRKKTIDGRLVRIYKGTECHGCHIRRKCTDAKQRTVQRSENQEWIDGFHNKMNSPQAREKLVTRRSVAEHPFGTIKYHMGQIPLLLRSKKKVQIEMNLYAIGYNLKRYFNILAAENPKSGKSLTELAA